MTAHRPPPIHIHIHIHVHVLAQIHVNRTCLLETLVHMITERTPVLCYSPPSTVSIGRW